MNRCDPLVKNLEKILPMVQVVEAKPVATDAISFFNKNSTHTFFPDIEEADGHIAVQWFVKEDG